ncbi:MAG: GNAT family N-acetyltransferase [Tannerella sp.]|jgi:GNAT superfamily N-acetyltransferase|nr:GNAT family N-acetyltransferase [Tannerella sp.]
MDDLFIEKMRDSEMNEVAAILTDAFKTNPAYSILFQKKNQLEDGLRWLFKTNLFIINRKQPLTSVVKEKNTGKITGTYTLIPPQGTRKTFSTYSKIGLPGFILKFGINPLVRMLGLDNYNKKLLTESMKNSAYYYMSMVVIRKEYRGTGVGTYAIKHAIREHIASNPTCNLIGLTTQLPENVIFYSRLGFDKLDEGRANFKGDEYYNCNMKLVL